MNFKSNKNKIALIAIVFLVGIFLGTLFTNNSSQPDIHDHESDQITEWTCSMHPQIRQPEPGQCPICAMDLIPVSQDKSSNNDNVPELTLGKTAMALADIETYKVKRQQPVKTLRLYGTIVIDETQKGAITAWFPGRIEEQYINYTGALIKKGEPLVKIYSPELYTAQQEFISTLNISNPVVSIESTQKKLELLGLSKKQINSIRKNKKPVENLTIYSPMNGIVLDINSREGNYVKTGTPLYDIASLDELWVELEAYEADIPWLKNGAAFTVNTESLPGKEIKGTISFIEPVLKKGARTAIIRGSLDNKNGLLKPGMFVTANIQTGIQKMHDGLPVLIPASAPLITGKRAIVYVQDPNDKSTFYGKEVKLGERSNDMYVVKEGLDEGETVVTKGNFKIDSALQLYGKKSMMSASIIGGMNMGHQHNSSQEPSYNKATDHNQKSIVTVPKALESQVTDIYIQYFELQKSLSQDNLASSKQIATELGKTVKDTKIKNDILKDILKASNDLGSSNSLKDARTAFHTISYAMIQLANQKFLPENKDVYRLHCPMAFDNSGADWLQTHRDVENPYFGSQMLSCGSVKETLQKVEKQKTLQSKEYSQLYLNYFALQKALSLDDHTLSKKEAQNLITSLPNNSDQAILEIKSSAKEISNSESLKQARMFFQPLSNALLSLADQGLLPENQNIYKVHCPMAFDNSGADWLQTHRDVENPYFGSQMYRCGSVEKVIQETNSGDK